MRRFLVFAALAVLAAPALIAVAGLEAAPATAARRAAEPADARRARQIVRDFRTLTNGDEPGRALRLTAEDLDSLAAVAARFAPGLRAEAGIGAEGLAVTAALPVPLSGGRLWWNLRARIPAPRDHLALSALSLGAVPLPAAAARPAVGLVADLALGDDAGGLLLAAVDRVAVDGAALELGVAMTEPERRRVTASVRRLAARLGFGSDPDAVGRRLAEIAAPPAPGGLGPLLARALAGAAADAVAAEGEAEGLDAARSLSAALFAAAIACGETRIERVAARDGFAASAAAAAACAPVRLEGRVDLRRHFVLSAALEAAAAEGHAFAIGEMKELLDASGGGSGFSFDDLAADRAGVRFARVALAAGPEGWEALAARLEAGVALLPSLEGLEAGLSAEAFAETYGGLDDPRYAALVAEIDRRLDAMALYATRAARAP